MKLSAWALVIGGVCGCGGSASEMAHTYDCCLEASVPHHVDSAGGRHAQTRQPNK